MTAIEIDELVASYADHHGVTIEEVDVSRNYSGDDVIGVRLSLDVDGVSRGDDERYGEWR
ncbi:MAG: hypothetical protein LC745_01935 [Planctomycetia bacterium]|nr:hypothetical protein [Planctomycetia bacterium]